MSTDKASQLNGNSYFSVAMMSVPEKFHCTNKRTNHSTFMKVLEEFIYIVKFIVA